MLSISFNPMFRFTTNWRFLYSPRTRAGRLEFICAVSGCGLLESLEFYGHMDWSAVCGLWPSVLVSGCDLWMVSTASLSSSRRWRSDLFSPFSWYRQSISYKSSIRTLINRQLLENNKCTRYLSFRVLRRFFFLISRSGFIWEHCPLVE